MKKRLFVGIPLDRAYAQLFEVVKKQNEGVPNLRWIPTENLHLTVCFLGDVEEGGIEELKNMLSQGVKEQKSFSLSFEALIFGPPLRPPGMVWAKFQETDNWYQCVEKIHEACEPYFESPSKQRQLPHITLARFKNSLLAKQIDLELTPLDLHRLTVNHCSLYESQLHSDGSRYTVLSTFPFV